MWPWHRPCTLDLYQLQHVPNRAIVVRVCVTWNLVRALPWGRTLRTDAEWSSDLCDTCYLLKWHRGLCVTTAKGNLTKHHLDIKLTSQVQDERRTLTIKAPASKERSCDDSLQGMLNPTRDILAHMESPQAFEEGRLTLLGMQGTKWHPQAK